MSQSIRSFVIQIIFYTIWIVIGLSVYTTGWIEGWNRLYIPAMSVPFGDMRTIQASIHSVDIGLNPQISNPSDILQRPLNYPSIWVSIGRFLHLENENFYNFFCISMVTSYIVLCSRLLVKSNSILVFPLFFSGASLLAVERGNIDLIIFILMYTACITPNTISSLSFLTAIGLKIYPVFGILTFYKNQKKIMILACISLIVLFFILPEIKAIKAATPVPYFLSYGSPSIAGIFDYNALVLHKWNAYALFLYNWGTQITSLIISAIILSGALILRYSKWKKINLSNYADYYDRLMFIMGASIYVGTFIFNSNFDYRLIFILLCLPYVIKLNNSLLRNAILAMVFLASNEWILANYLAGAFGWCLSVMSKVGLFIIFINILIDLCDIVFLEKLIQRFSLRNI